MFKAIHTLDDQEIIILDPEWEDVNKLNELRGLDRRDLLVCQECRQPVRVRAGEDRQWHFAHKHRQNCTYQSESAALLRARAALYRWLIEKFGANNVELEKKIGGKDVPRPVDCWVQGEKSAIAFWISDAGMKPQIREVLQRRFQQLKVNVQWLFTTSMLREQEEPGRVTLSTTERELMIATRYDAIYEPRRGRGRSLHYLDGSSATLITFRGLYLVHSPHTFEGHKITDSLRDIQLLRQSGGLVHPGEHEVWEAYRAEMEARESQPGQLPRYEPAAPQPPPPIVVPSPPVFTESAYRPPKLSTWSEDASSERAIKVGTCIFCGQETTDYWFYDGKTKTCRCRPCRAKGRE